MRRGPINRSFTKPEVRSLSVFSASSFEQMVESLNISPHEYRSSAELKEWVRQNKDQRYTVRIAKGIWIPSGHLVVPFAPTVY